MQLYSRTGKSSGRGTSRPASQASPPPLSSPSMCPHKIFFFEKPFFSRQDAYRCAFMLSALPSSTADSGHTLRVC